MNDQDLLAKRFEEHRGHLHSVAYRMLGSTGEADDAVQEAWLRLSRSDHDQVENLRAWLTTVVGRVSLDMLRARKARREAPDGGGARRAPRHRAHRGEPRGGSRAGRHRRSRDDGGPRDPLPRGASGVRPARHVRRPVQRDRRDRGPQRGRSAAAREPRPPPGPWVVPPPDPDLDEQRQVVEAFLAAARAGDFEALLDVLDPNVVQTGSHGQGRPALGAEPRSGRRRSPSARSPAAAPSLPTGARRSSTATWARSSMIEGEARRGERR